MGDVALVARTLIVVTAAIFGTAAAAQPAETYKIGSVLSLTGPMAFLGDPTANGAKLAIDRANASGGINGKRIEFVSYDDEGSADKALTFTKKLIGDDKVP